MNTRQLTYVLSIAETGNLSAAAKELGVSQPALSKYLAELEDELGTELFLRYKKQLYPTAAGKIYLEAATRIIGVKEQTYQMISELSNGYQKTLHSGSDTDSALPPSAHRSGSASPNSGWSGCTETWGQYQTGPGRWQWVPLS